METSAFNFSHLIKEETSWSLDEDVAVPPIFDLNHLPSTTLNETDLEATKSTDALFSHVPPKPNMPIHHFGKRPQRHQPKISDISVVNDEPQYTEDDEELIKVLGLRTS